MRTVAVTRIGSLRDPDEQTRGRIGVVDFPDQPLGPEDVRIRVAYSAICGSDPHLAEGFFGTDVPIGLGHELSGIVEALGEAAHRNGLQVGDRVAGNFLRFCGTCSAVPGRARSSSASTSRTTTAPAWPRRSRGTSRRSTSCPTTCRY